MNNFLVCNVGWMDRYDGPAQIIGGGSYVQEHGFGHETYNFKQWNGQYYGYVQPSGSSINVRRLGAEEGADSVGGMTVVWTAKRPRGGVVVVGWYGQGIVHRSLKDAPSDAPRLDITNTERRCGYFIEAPVSESRLLAVDERVIPVPRGKGGMGQSNVWYADRSEKATAFREFVMKMITTGNVPTISSGRGVRGKRGGWKVDVIKRQKVERAAVNAVAQWYERRGYSVASVEQEKCGWDLDAFHTDSHEVLRVEVKGLSGKDVFAEVSSNEYAKMIERKRKGYRLCIVTEALCQKNRRLHIFHFSDEQERWIDDNGRRLCIEEVKSAQCCLENNP